MEIIKKGWSGEPVAQPKPELINVEVDNGTKITAVDGIGNPTALVQQINENSIVLITSKLAPREEGSGINLTKDYSNLETVIKTGESCKFSTQTTDAGDSYTFTLREVRA